MTDKTEKVKKNSAKKKLLISIAVIICIIVILIICSVIIDIIEKNSSDFEIDYNFYPADYDEDIFTDEKYLQLTAEEFIKYHDSTTNITLGIDKESAKSQGEAVEFLVDMIYDIINGDHVSYNNKFSKQYYNNNSPKERFTMQKVYDVTITYISTEDTENYTKYTYCIEYKIHENNGTFRRDIGDGSKKQYITLSDASGELLIDTVSTVRVAVK